MKLFGLHLWKSGVEAIITQEMDNRVSQAIADQEVRSYVEINWAFEKRLPWIAFGSVKRRVDQLFRRMGMGKTMKKTGVLICVFWNKKIIYIEGDQGIDNHVSDEFWAEVAAEAAKRIGSEDLEAGLKYAIEKIGEEVAKHFPILDGEENPNELDNHGKF